MVLSEQRLVSPRKHSAQWPQPYMGTTVTRSPSAKPSTPSPSPGYIAGYLVAHDNGRHPLFMQSLVGVQFRPADTGVACPDQHFSRAGLWHINIDILYMVRLCKNCSLHLLHVCASSAKFYLEHRLADSFRLIDGEAGGMDVVREDDDELSRAERQLGEVPVVEIVSRSAQPLFPSERPVLKHQPMHSEPSSSIWISAKSL